MQEAFRQALEQSKAASELDPEILRVVEAEAHRPESMSEAELGRFRDRVRGLGRAWRAYINAGEPSPAKLKDLRTEWSAVAEQLGPMPREQRLVVLEDFDRALGFDDDRQARRMRAYLTRAGAGPDLNARLAPILSLTTPDAYLILTVEELAVRPAEELQALYASLAEQPGRPRSARSRGPLEALATWIAGD